MPELLTVWTLLVVLKVLALMGYDLFSPTGVFFIATGVVVCLLLFRRHFGR